MQGVSAALSRLAQGIIAIACVALVSMTGVEAWQVFARYVLNNSPSWTEPVALLLMSTAMMLGAAPAISTFQPSASRIPPQNASSAPIAATTSRLIATNSRRTGGGATCRARRNPK